MCSGDGRESIEENIRFLQGFHDQNRSHYLLEANEFTAMIEYENGRAILGMATLLAAEEMKAGC